MDGKRPARGGAAALFPFQSPGEWAILLSAFRLWSDQLYEGMSGLRPALLGYPINQGGKDRFRGPGGPGPRKTRGAG